MRIEFSKFLLSCFAAGLLTFFYSCEKETDKMIPPVLEFKTGPGYTSNDTTVGINTQVRVGIHAEKTEGEDYLNTFTVSHSFDGALPPVTGTSFVIDESGHDVFEEDVTITTRPETGSEAYSFTITNRDGLVVTKTLTLTVQ